MAEDNTTQKPPEAPGSTQAAALLKWWPVFLGVIAAIGYIIHLDSRVTSLGRNVDENKLRQLKEEALKDLNSATVFDSQVPVGTIIASMLTPEAMEKFTKKWILADGSGAPVDSRYFNTISKTVPNLCGVFLRGRNRDNDPQALTYGNPEGPLPPGTYRQDMMLRHNHRVYTGNMGKRGEIRGDDGGRRENEEIYTEYFPKEANSVNETRPRNVTVNYFIKVN